MSLYRLLGVAKSASKQEIKAAYRKLALQFHPDKHVQSPPQAKAAAAAKFRQISSAYDTLVDDRKRAAYDHSPGNVGEARRQPNPRNSSSTSAQSHSPYTSSSNSGDGDSFGGRLRRFIRDLDALDILGLGLIVIGAFSNDKEKKENENGPQKENDRRREHR